VSGGGRKRTFIPFFLILSQNNKRKGEAGGGGGRKEKVRVPYPFFFAYTCLGTRKKEKEKKKKEEMLSASICNRRVGREKKGRKRVTPSPEQPGRINQGGGKTKGEKEDTRQQTSNRKIRSGL